MVVQRVVGPGQHPVSHFHRSSRPANALIKHTANLCLCPKHTARDVPFTQNPPPLTCRARSSKLPHSRSISLIDSLARLRSCTARSNSSLASRSSSLSWARSVRRDWACALREIWGCKCQKLSVHVET